MVLIQDFCVFYFSSVPSVQSLTVFTQALPPHATEALY